MAKVTERQMSLSEKSRGIAIGDTQTMANHRQGPRTKEESVPSWRKRSKLERVALNKSALEENEGSKWWHFSLGAGRTD